MTHPLTSAVTRIHTQPKDMKMWCKYIRRRTHRLGQSDLNRFFVSCKTLNENMKSYANRNTGQSQMLSQRFTNKMHCQILKFKAAIKHGKMS